MLSDLAQRWLVHARAVFACTSHHSACDAPAVPGIDPALRWPGFVGPEYERAKKKLLLVGRIHNPSGWENWPGLGALQPLIHEWLSGARSDEAFYTDYNREYARRLVTWGPWRKVYDALASAAGVGAHGVAYANVAKCWQYPGKESRLQRACSRAFPLEELVDIVKAHGVFVLATDAWVAGVPDVRVQTAAFRNDSAPHFQIPYDRLVKHVEWVRGL